MIGVLPHFILLVGTAHTKYIRLPVQILAGIVGRIEAAPVEIFPVLSSAATSFLPRLALLCLPGVCGRRPRFRRH